jgi:hypothetical protein
MTNLAIPAISSGVEMREILRKQVKLQRDKKRVRERDSDGTAAIDDAGDDPA